MQQWEYCSMTYDYKTDIVTILVFSADGNHTREERRIPIKQTPPEVSPVVFQKKRRGQPPAEVQAAIVKRRENYASYVNFHAQLTAELGLKGWEMISGGSPDDAILFKRPVITNRD